jgi:hypothetical protein
MTTVNIPEHAPTITLRGRNKNWEIGDVVEDGGYRWIIRTITGTAVELEAASASPGIWWNTLLSLLPKKAAR